MVFALALLLVPSAGCKRYRARRWAYAPRAESLPPPPFASPLPLPASVERWLSRAPMIAPFVTVAEGWAVAMEPAGNVRYTFALAGAPVVRETRSPCRYDASRHASSWTIPTRIGLDGRGHACCVHDGDEQAPAGAYCADLRVERPQWRRARTPWPATGAGSGDGALALFATDVWCTRDGGVTVFATFRGDPEQPLAVASCSARGEAASGGGARSLGALRHQTLRAAPAGSGMSMIEDAPRGEPVDVRARVGGEVQALFLTVQGPRYIVRDAAGRVQTYELPGQAGRAIGAWGRGVALLAPPGRIESVDSQGQIRVRTTEGELASLVAATRVGPALVGVTRDGQLVELRTE